MLTTGEPSQLHLQHKTKSLRLLQEDINRGCIDEVMCMSLISQVAVERCVGNVEAMWKHINGLHLVFERVKQQGLLKGELSPLAGALPRVIARLDYNAAILTEELPRSKPFTIEDEIEAREYLRRARLPGSKTISEENIEWILASFEINNLWHRTFLFAKKAEEYKRAVSRDPEAYAKIEFERYILTQEIEEWRQRPKIQDQDSLEGTSTNSPPHPQHPRLSSFSPTQPCTSPIASTPNS